jgi:hypothetical protein
VKSATGKWTRNGWTLGSDQNIENRARSLLRSPTRRQVIRGIPASTNVSKGGDDLRPGEGAIVSGETARPPLILCAKEAHELGLRGIQRE